MTLRPVRGSFAAARYGDCKPGREREAAATADPGLAARGRMFPMCGIAGILCRAGAPPEIAALRAMAAALRHRGPDGAGVFRDARCGLAHTRLAIIDSAGGQQ